MTNHTKEKATRSVGRDSYHHGDLRRDLVRVARAEIADNGAERVSLASLARLAGVAQSAPYRHFTDRQTLLAAVATEGFEELVAVMRDAIVTTGDVSPADRIAAAYVRFGETNIELYRLMFSSRLTPNALDNSPLDAAAGQAFAMLRDAVGAADRIVYRSWALLHGLVMLKADGFIRSPLEHWATNIDQTKRCA